MTCFFRILIAFVVLSGCSSKPRFVIEKGNDDKHFIKKTIFSDSSFLFETFQTCDSVTRDGLFYNHLNDSIRISGFYRCDTLCGVFQSRNRNGSFYVVYGLLGDTLKFRQLDLSNKIVKERGTLKIEHNVYVNDSVKVGDTKQVIGAYCFCPILPDVGVEINDFYVFNDKDTLHPVGYLCKWDWYWEQYYIYKGRGKYKHFLKIHSDDHGAESNYLDSIEFFR